MRYSNNFDVIKSNEEIFEEIVSETRQGNYYALPYQDIDKILEFSKNIKQNHIAVIGIGGSSLGTYAIHKFLKPKKLSRRKLHFFDSTDPLDLKQKLAKLDLKDTLFLLISKSGITLESICIFKYLASLVRMSKENCVVISESDSPLRQYAKSNETMIFHIPKSVCGRFSVFSHAGLVPLALIGVNIKSLLEGCKEVNESFFKKQEYYEFIFKKARFLIENRDRFNINIVFSYSSILEIFNKWYVQLWGESLGKIDLNGIRQGLTPIGLVGPADQHSFLQLINEGKRDKTVTFIKVENLEDDIKIPSCDIDKYVGLEYVDNIKFQDLISYQCDATIQSIKELEDVPYDLVVIDKVDEKSIAKLMYFYELLTSVVGKFMQIDAYNQPGVERGKRALRSKL